MTVELSSDVIGALLNEAIQAEPFECCGILLGTGARVIGIHPAANVHVTPQTHFEIEPQALIDCHRAARKDGLQIIGYYHSHPNGLSRPSATDAAMAARDGSIWAIVAAGRVTCWRSGDAGFEALPYRTAPR